jgi:carboxyl-terminal processing protease
MEDGAVKVMSVTEDSPAHKAGLKTGDFLTHLNGKLVYGGTLDEAVEQMRGPPGTGVKITVVRPGRDKPFDVNITRAIIELPAVKWEVKDRVGIINVNSFNRTTTENVLAAIAGVEKSLGGRPLGYVLDLRSNPGGLLDQAVSLSDAFLERGEIVSTRGRNADETQRFSAKAGDLTKGKPLVVLVNGGSASASEIVAGALQDHKRAIVMGTRSFGKGSVQTIIPLGGQGAVRLTTARYYTPSGRSIQAKGIDPDREVLQDVPEELKGKDETKGEAGLRGHLKSDKEERGGSSAYVPTDPAKDKQLIAAYEYLRGFRQGAANTATGVPN